MDRQKMLLVFNPKSGREEFPINLFEVVDKYTKHGFEVTAFPTQAPGDAYNLILERAGDFSHLVCSGGDGTLDEVIDALMNLERRPVFGYIPSGTTNDFANSLGLPKDILEAAAVMVEGQSQHIDIGAFEHTFFSYVAAFGLFTDVTYETSQGMKNILGHTAYLLEGIKRLASVHAHRCAVVADGEEVAGDFIFGMVCNSHSVGGYRLPREFDIRMDDGVFEVVLIQKPKNFLDLQDIIASLLNQELYTDSLILRKAKHVVIKSAAPIRWTLDGEFGGEFDQVTIQNHHRAMEIMVPRGEG